MASKAQRTNDCMYDPNFIVSTEKEYDKHAFKATMASAQKEIAPVFENMFSELTNCPRQTVVVKVGKIPQCRPASQRRTSQMLLFDPHPVDITGTDRAIFCKMPIVTLSSQLLINKLVLDHPKQPPKVKTKPFHTRGIQTMYRESSAQTSPWKTENYIIMDDSEPEILKLNFLKENLPPGMHEVEIIKRARRQRAWEQLMPDVEDAATLEQRRLIISAIEMDQWAFRENELKMIQDLRFELLERMLQELLESANARTENKLNRIAARLENEHKIEMEKLKRRTNRELRLLYRQNMGISTKYKKVNVLDEYRDYKSEVYAPLMRHGEHPKRGHAKINLEYYDPSLFEIEYMSTLPRWILKEELVNVNALKLPGRRLCIRETKWTAPVLKELHDELHNLNQTIKLKCTLRELKVKRRVLADTVYIDFDRDEAENLIKLDALLMLQCIIRGRATQTLIYEGRDRCRELIEELQCTHFLDISQNLEMRRRRMEVMNQQRNRQVLMDREKHLEAALNTLQCGVVGTMLNFLSKELVRIRDERKAHALALLYERERRDREACEAGRRQVEERRRQEHDEMFKQMVKVNQDTVDLYLQDIITEGVEHASKKEAEKYVKNLAAQIEEESQEPPKTFIDKEELIANMVCHFLNPEAEKQRIREKCKKRQQKYLRCAHEVIYNKFEKLPSIKNEVQDNCQSIEKFELPSMDNIEQFLEDVEQTNTTTSLAEAVIKNIGDKATYPHD